MGIFGKKNKNAEPVQPVRSISVAPGQSAEEQAANRSRMEAELEAQRAAREAKKAEAAK